MPFLLSQMSKVGRLGTQAVPGGFMFEAGDLFFAGVTFR